MWKKYATLFLLLLLTACRSYESHEFTRYYDDGRIKPKVALVPVSSPEAFNYSWSITQELTDTIRQELVQQNTLYLSDDHTLSSLLPLRSKDLISEQSSLIQQLKNQYDFAVVMDLVSHEQEPYKGQTVTPVYTVYGEVAQVLKLTMRVNVFDLRGAKPQNILQELVHSNHFISKEGAATDYNKVVWQTDAYKTSPFGLAHSRLSKEVASRMSEYIQLARR